MENQGKPRKTKPRASPGRTKSGHESTQALNELPRAPRMVSKGPQGDPKGAPRAPRERLISLQGHSKSLQERPKSPQECSKSLQE